jgi:3-oxoacyl-[acyl-carrier protein] reductase
VDLGLHGRVALVAGASSGLGYAVAHALAVEGCVLSVCGRNPERLDAAVNALRVAGGGKVLGRVVDVTDDAARADWVAETVAELGGLQIVVANGGGPPPGGVEDFAPDAYRRAADTAVLPHIGLVLAALPYLREAGWGRVLIVASETVRQPIARYGLSSTVRPALLGFARSLAQSLGPCGVTVNVLAPGYHDTEGLRRQFPDDASAAEGLAEIAAGVPVGRLGRPADFGAVAAFLASEAASFVTGTTLLVDGGATRGL